MLDPRDGAAACADLENIHHRNLNRQRLLIASDKRTPGRQRLPVQNDAGLGGGPAHVEGDSILEIERLGDCLRADHAGSRARFEHANAFRLGAADAEKSTSRLNHEKVAAKSAVRDPLLDFLKITSHPRTDISVGDDRRAPLELAVLLRQLVRGRNEMTGKLSCKIALARRSCSGLR